ncbi:unnamed protein product [Arctia plantaginis]|uniref:Uncharacterized protein n=1 Tax=Arctia plantaginis TaxID=874455 RepID=A0A8S0ZA31_ARCPL|nr:unnamed protein product [Arctia plantaginis]
MKNIDTSGVVTKKLKEICPAYKKSPSVDVADLVGNWMTVFTQPEAIDCFTVHIRATTEMEREIYTTKYGNFSSSVDWSRCFLQVGTPLGKHFLQGNGTESGLMENIIIFEDKPGKYK